MTTLKCPMTAKQALDLYFLDNRARMLEIAAFLDRIDRYDGTEEARKDFRYRSFIDALKAIIETRQDRTVTLQKMLSDTTLEPLETIEDLKAYGAWKGYEK